MAEFCVGLTGGIASGKSAATRCFEALGVTVADADVAAREAVAPGSKGLAAVCSAFGDGVLDGTGALDRRRMRERVFNDPDARHRLEAIIHPIVRTRLRAQCEAATDAYAVAAIPLLAEGGRDAYPWLGRVVVVDVAPTVQIERLLRRDGIDRPLAERMLAAQASREQRLAIADDVLVNDGTLDALAALVTALDARYRRLLAAGMA